jgi:hypothetical protein
MLGLWGCPYGKDGGGGLVASSWGFPRVHKLWVSSEDGGGTHATSLCGSPRVCKPHVSSEDGGGDLAASSWISLAFANGVGPARTAVVLTLPLLAYAGCPGSDNGGGVLTASLLPLVMDLGSGVGDSPVRTAVGCSSPRSGVSLAFANRVCPVRMAVVLTPPLLTYGCCAWVCSRTCRQRRRRWSSRRLALCFSWPVVATMGLLPSSSPSGRRRQVAVVILVVGTLFSSWRALAGAGYLLRGVRWSVVGTGRWVLTCTGYLFFSFLLIAVGCCSRCRSRHPFPGEGEVVVWWWKVVEFRLFVEFKPREFRHMTPLTPSKRRGDFNSAYLSASICKPYT